jgi:L-fucose isomerase-like protein
MSSQSLIEYWKSWKGKIDIKDITESIGKNYLPKDRKMEDVKKMYLILKSLIEKKKVNAFTINCLASIIHTNLKVTPCYALSRLNDEVSKITFL